MNMMMTKSLHKLVLYDAFFLQIFSNVGGANIILVICRGPPVSLLERDTVQWRYEVKNEENSDVADETQTFV